MAVNQRAHKRKLVAADGMIYDLQGRAVAPVTVRNVSAGGAQLELAQEVDLPNLFSLALTRDGQVRRACKKIWQFATVAGVSFYARRMG